MIWKSAALVLVLTLSSLVLITSAQDDDAVAASTENASLAGSAVGASEPFGVRSAIDGEVVIVGNMQNDEAGTTGSVAVFSKDRNSGVWGGEPTLTASDNSSGDLFASAIDNDSYQQGMSREFDTSLVSLRPTNSRHV